MRSKRQEIGRGGEVLGLACGSFSFFDGIPSLLSLWQRGLGIPFSCACGKGVRVGSFGKDQDEHLKKLRGDTASEQKVRAC